jgi:4-diphosphocytidyl-2-C-methyl-D-erythritol kinase
VIVFPHCKINIGLQVLHKRSDGFHAIATVFYPVPLKDSLEIIPAAGSHQPTLYNYGLSVNGAPEDNLCIKAWQLLQKDFPELPAVQVHLLKNIPMGAGLGGGSADGAFMLQLLNNKYQLGLSAQQLIDYALQLGSDCPFFILGPPCYATGRGEIMEPMVIDLSGYRLLLASPGIHINTGWAFGQLAMASIPKTATVKEAVLQPLQQWKESLVNDFEKPVFEQYPAIRNIKENLYQLGAVYAAMSGSGSTVYGLFNKATALPAVLPAHHRVIQL